MVSDGNLHPYTECVEGWTLSGPFASTCFEDAPSTVLIEFFEDDMRLGGLSAPVLTRSDLAILETALAGVAGLPAGLGLSVGGGGGGGGSFIPPPREFILSSRGAANAPLFKPSFIS